MFRVRKLFLLRRGLEVLIGNEYIYHSVSNILSTAECYFFSGVNVSVAVVQQYIIPSVVNSLIPFASMDLSLATERLLKVCHGYPFVITIRHRKRELLPTVCFQYNACSRFVMSFFPCSLLYLGKERIPFFYFSTVSAWHWTVCEFFLPILPYFLPFQALYALY
jgi:hypothetical protein